MPCLLFYSLLSSWLSSDSSPTLWMVPLMFLATVTVYRKTELANESSELMAFGPDLFFV